MKALKSLVIAVSIFSTGCASYSDNISPANIPSSTYSDYSCVDMKQLLTESIQLLRSYENKQDNMANDDRMGFAVELLTMGQLSSGPTSVLTGSNHREDISLLKGHIIVLESEIAARCY